MIAVLPLHLLAPGPALAAARWQEVALHLAWQGGLSGLEAPAALGLASATLGVALSSGGAGRRTA